MAEKEKKEAKVTANLTQESIKIMSESVGITGFPDEAASRLAVDTTYKLKQIIQEAAKFMQHAKRRKLNTNDFDNALKAKNIEPLYGFQSQEYLPFRHASGGGREVHFHEEKEIDLQEIIAAPLPKIPVDVTMRTHWLAIDGAQPTVPENPPPVSKDLQKQEAVDPLVKAAISKPKPRISNEPGKLKHKVKGAEKVKLKELSTHELSVEQQLYYKEITEACVGSDEPRRSEALTSLSMDPGLHQMLPRFTMFVSEGVKVNVVQNNLALLIYLMRMVKSLMDNPTLYLEKYLHDLVPAIATCVLSKQLCLRPDVDNHWALRDFAARQMAQLCRMFNTTTNCIQSRVTKMYSAALQAEKSSLATHYGAVVGLQELGTEVVKTFVIPMLKSEGERLQYAAEGPLTTEMDKGFVDHIKSALLGKCKKPRGKTCCDVTCVCDEIYRSKNVPAVLKTVRSAPDVLDEYREEYGNYLGPALQAAVIKHRQIPTVNPTQAASANPFKPSAVSFAPKTSSLLAASQPTTIRTGGTPTRFPGSNIVSLTPTNPQQKVVFMTQQHRPTTPTVSNPTIFSSVPNTPTPVSSTPTIIKMVSQNNTVTGTSGPAPGQKIVVVSMASSNSASQVSPLDVGIKSVFTTSSSGLTQQPEIITLDGAKTEPN